LTKTWQRGKKPGKNLAAWQKTWQKPGSVAKNLAKTWQSQPFATCCNADTKVKKVNFL